MAHALGQSQLSLIIQSHFWKPHLFRGHVELLLNLPGIVAAFISPDIKESLGDIAMNKNAPALMKQERAYALWSCFATFDLVRFDMIRQSLI